MLGKRSVLDNLYELLGVENFSSDDEIKRGFRLSAKKTHPDANKNNPLACRDFGKIREAYEFLSDLDRRKNYDRELKYFLVKKEKEGELEKVSNLSDIEKCEIILVHSMSLRSFNASFVHSCINRLATGKELTTNQKQALVNILVRYRIDIEAWRDEKKRVAALDVYLKKQGL
jgi:curved DNA-binding protein CbpA